MITEHILFSIAVAVTIGALYSNSFRSTLPIWIIAACAWLPDIDYIVQTVTFYFYPISHFVILHGDFHNIFILFGFSFVIAYIFKFYNMEFNKVFLCVTIGWITHILCDYLVYDAAYQPFYPIHCVIWSCQLIAEYGSFYGLGELSLLSWGCIFIAASLAIKFLLTRNIEINITGTEVK